MSAPRSVPMPEPPRLGLTMAEAAAALSVSPDYFRDHVQGEVRIVRRGRRRIVPVSELQRWLDENAEAHLPWTPGLDRGAKHRLTARGFIPRSGSEHRVQSGIARSRDSRGTAGRA